MFEQKKNEKWLSRKFLVWFAWLIFCILSCIFENIPSDKCFEYFGFVSLIYIGANAAQDFAPLKTPKFNFDSDCVTNGEKKNDDQ